jgi:hypothetical protein
VLGLDAAQFADSLVQALVSLSAGALDGAELRFEGGVEHGLKARGADEGVELSLGAVAAEELPGSAEDLVKEDGFDGGAGAEIAKKISAEGVELGAQFFGDIEVAGEEAVTGRVA